MRLQTEYPHVIRDRDYIRDSNGNYLRIIGDHHPDGQILSFVKYFPSSFGVREIHRQYFGYNTFIAKSFVLLRDNSDRLIFSEHLGSIITTTPITQVVEYYSCREKTKKILSQKEKYLLHPVGKHLVRFTEEASKYMDIKDLGVTGSFLFDAENDGSDIDLVCYGQSAYNALVCLFQSTNILQRYEGELAIELYKRRMTHLASMDFKTLLLQESRKLQAVISDTNIHINCQPLRNDGDDFMDIHLFEIGDISCIAEIVGDSQGIFSPAYYSIKVHRILNCLFAGEDFKQQITILLSLSGTYSQVFKSGDCVYLEGKLVKVEGRGISSFGVELTSWHTSHFYKATLL